MRTVPLLDQLTPSSHHYTLPKKKHDCAQFSSQGIPPPIIPGAKKYATCMHALPSSASFDGHPTVQCLAVLC